MSFKYTRVAWHCSIPASPKLDLLCLADFADEAGKCWPSQQTIASRTGHNERTVRANLAWLESHGLIERRARATREKRLSDLITLRLSQPEEIAGCTTGNKQQPEENAQQPEENALQPANPAGNPTSEPINKPPTNRKCEEDLFEEFMRAYPKRDVEPNLRAAKKIFLRHLKNGDADAMIGGAARYYEALRQKGKLGTQYVAEPATWLRDERWKQYAVGSGCELKNELVHLQSKCRLQNESDDRLWIANRTPEWGRLERFLEENPRPPSNGIGYRKMPDKAEKGWFFELPLCIEAGLIEQTRNRLAA